jgi:hypothetical protein
MTHYRRLLRGANPDVNHIRLAKGDSFRITSTSVPKEVGAWLTAESVRQNISLYRLVSSLIEERYETLTGQKLDGTADRAVFGPDYKPPSAQDYIRAVKKRKDLVKRLK